MSNAVHVVFGPLVPNQPIVVPSDEALRELEAAFDAAVLALDDDLPWQPVDDSPPHGSGVFVVDRT